jgi:hypothetical protein
MTRACGVSDTDLRAFAAGEATVEEHVAGCDECQAFLAELWSGSLEHDLAGPVVQLLELERFLQETGRLSFDLTARYSQALARYLFGAEEDA